MNLRQSNFFIGVDVGTGSARAGVFDRAGRGLGFGSHAIELWRPADDFVEQSSENIWSACGAAIRAAMSEAGAAPKRVSGIAFDAACSLVALDAQDRPVSISPTGRDEQNVIVWMDHRAAAQADRINGGEHAVLRYVGGKISPEMQVPKILWLKEHLRKSFDRTAHFFDLADFLTYRATGMDARSRCTVTCKWTYRPRVESSAETKQPVAEGWDEDFFQRVGLADLAEERFARIGQRVLPLGSCAGQLTPASANELRLAEGIAVGTGIIDAHAGGLGMLGMPLEGAPDLPGALNHRVALIGGTSSCHMAVSSAPRFIEGVWGPYRGAMVPGTWLNEGGQSATGALIDHTIDSHVRGAELACDAEARGTTVYALLNERLDRLVDAHPSIDVPAELTRDLHVLPDHHGNRSPRADASLRGAVTGLSLTDNIDSLALLYLATIQAIAHGTRHIIDTLNHHGYEIDTILACGGDTKNSVFIREHADITGCRVIIPREPESVLLGAAMLAAAATEESSLADAMTSMSAPDRIHEPTGGNLRAYHEKKHRVFHQMHEDSMRYRQLMR